MSERKVDPVAILESSALRDDGINRQQQREAIAAVRELVEAATEAFNAPDVMWTIASESDALAERLEAALSKFPTADSEVENGR